MQKEKLKQIRDKMIYDMWEQKKAEWTMEDIGIIFNLKIAQMYRIVKVEVDSKEKSNINLG